MSVMDSLRTGVLVLFVLLEPVSCKDLLWSEPLLCYVLDGVLIVYCIIATALFFREKFSHVPSETIELTEHNGGIYQELERPHEADPYQVLEPSKRKKKGGKKKKPQPTPAESNEVPYESLTPNLPPPPLSPR